jgi:NDP-sugar pyrophosphorylase family protein
LKDLINFHREQHATATIAVHHRKVKIDLGVVESDASARINGYIEKPTYDYCVSMGIYVFEPRVINFIPRGAYLDFPDLVKKMVAAGEKVVGYHFEGYWQDLGRPDDYELASQDFERLRFQFLPQEQCT